MEHVAKTPLLLGNNPVTVLVEVFCQHLSIVESCWCKDDTADTYNTTIHAKYKSARPYPTDNVTCEKC